MVLPVPGLPVNTRWWLVSIVGRPRSVAQLLDAQQAREAAHVGLDVVEPDERVELGEQLLDRACGRRRRRRDRLLSAPPVELPRRSTVAAAAGRAAATPAASNAGSTVARKRSMAAISSGDGTRSIAADGVGEA